MALRDSMGSTHGVLAGGLWPAIEEQDPSLPPPRWPCLDGGAMDAVTKSRGPDQVLALQALLLASFYRLRLPIYAPCLTMEYEETHSTRSGHLQGRGIPAHNTPNCHPMKRSANLSPGACQPWQ